VRNQDVQERHRHRCSGRHEHHGRGPGSRAVHGLVPWLRQPDHCRPRRRVLHAVRPRVQYPGRRGGRDQAGAGHRHGRGHGLTPGPASLFRGPARRSATGSCPVAPAAGLARVGSEASPFRVWHERQAEVPMGPIRHVKKVVMISALLLVLTLSLGGGVASKSNDSAAPYENLKLFTEVLSIIQSQYVDEVPAKDVIYSAIKGTLRGLDPHSSFLDPEMYREMQVETSGSFGGG